MPIDRHAVLDRLRGFDFAGLFTQELGWDWYTAETKVTVGKTDIVLKGVAEKRGVHVLLCPPGPDGRIPDAALRATVDRQVSKVAREHLLVFTDAASTEQVWLYPRREPGRPVRLVSYRFDPGKANELLLQKLASITFTLNEEEGLNLLGVVERLKDALDRDVVTKAFYQRFEKERAAFQKFLDGIPDKDLERWYVAVMMNRLMFIYFIQEKGFLGGGDQRYLQNRLVSCKGNFYRDFLCPLFFQGFALKPDDRPPQIAVLLGQVPYLNGGIFQQHEIETAHGRSIAVPNEAFARLFRFFDEWRWHLDERPIASGTEINPEILGYIFEKFINQKQMGAYYTKEDITGYIGRNTILPYILDAARAKCKVAFENPGGPTVWDCLRADPDRYIYAAVRKGAELPLPAAIEKGVDTKSPNLLERRSGWNKAAPSDYALPTEIWREVVARRQRHAEVKSRLIDSAAPMAANDLTTLNLDICQFLQDVIERCEGPDLLRALWRAISEITVLDPTCGSGAFLFAAVNILEPLYEGCLDRMEDLLKAEAAQLDPAKRKVTARGVPLLPHKKYEDFTQILDRVASHANRPYFVLKSIILNNLFGVDIMPEAVEICKLRLFLKLVAHVDPDPADPNLGIEPLPDIDFNIRAGNTLVGFATEKQAEDVIRQDLLAYNTVWPEVKREALEIAEMFALFRQQQTELGCAVSASDKKRLRDKLAPLEEHLNRYLAETCNIDVDNAKALSNWVRSHKPFHWFIEFYAIISTGGFDTIIGNPPYVEVPTHLNRRLLATSFRTAMDRWSRDENLYTFVVERSLELLRSSTGQFGMILPLSVAFSTKKPFILLRQVVSSEKGFWHWSHFDRIPSALFGNEVRTRCTIALLARDGASSDGQSTTSLLRWNAECREVLFRTIHYSHIELDITAGIPKVSSQVQADVLKTLTAANVPLAPTLAKSIPFPVLAAAAPKFPQPCVYVGGTAYNWFPAWRDIPKTTNIEGGASLPARTAGYKFPDEDTANMVFALLCSALGYWWWAVASDAFNLKKWLLERFPISPSHIPEPARGQLAELGAALRAELRRNYVYKDNKGRIGNFLLPACDRQTTDIDAFLASSVPGLSLEFFDNVRGFNAAFSRVEPDSNEEEAE